MRQVLLENEAFFPCRLFTSGRSYFGKKLLMERHENRSCREMAAAPTLETFKNRLE